MGKPTSLQALAERDPDAATEDIMDVCEKCRGSIPQMAVHFDVSYPTMLRILDRLDIRGKVREYWMIHK